MTYRDRRSGVSWRSRHWVCVADTNRDRLRSGHRIPLKYLSAWAVRYGPLRLFITWRGASSGPQARCKDRPLSLRCTGKYGVMPIGRHRPIGPVGLVRKNNYHHIYHPKYAPTQLVYKSATRQNSPFSITLRNWG